MRRFSRLELLLATFVGISEVYAQDVMIKIPTDVVKQIAQQAETSNVTALQALGVEDVASLEEAVPVRMRDGIELSATVVRPSANPTARRSVILVKTPYSPAIEWTYGFRKDLFSRLVKKGYILVAVNERGTRWSEGEYHWLKGAKTDGYDILSWIAAQPWSNGRVGTFGCSSSGEGQIPLATMNHPAHKAMVPMAASTGVGEIPGYADQGGWYMGGVPQLFYAWWFQINGHHARPLLSREMTREERVRFVRSYSPDPDPPFQPKLESHLPTADILKVAGSPKTDFDDLIRLTPGDPAWKQYDLLRTGDSTKVPALHIDSWYDFIEIYSTMRMYEYLSRNSPQQYLVVGPTPHCRQGEETERTMVGERQVGDARFDYPGLIISFFDHFVENDGRDEYKLPKVQYYPMGSNKWAKADEWPVPSKPYRLYLHSGGRANSIWGDGALLREAPQGADIADTYVSDALNAVPSRGASCCSKDMSVDQREIEARNDVLVYTSEPLEAPLTFVGYIKAKVHVRSDAPDTDLMLKLIDVYPDGRALNLLDSGKRLRYRNGIHKIEFMKPDETYEIFLDQMVTATRVEKGHRIRVEFASSNFPAYERNLNTGGNNFDESEPRRAVNSIVHGATHVSYLELPLFSEK